MGFIKRAFIAIRKRKSKTFLMLAILLVIGTMIMAGVAIQKATKTAMVLAREKLGSTITISYDMQKSMESMANQKGGGKRFAITSTPIDESWLEKVIALDNVKGYNYYVEGTANASGFEPVTETETETNSANRNKLGSFQLTGTNGVAVSMGDITVKGILDTSTETDNITLVGGRNLNKDDKGKNDILIEKNLLDSNNLKLGDKITLESMSKEDVSIEFTIVGVYTANNVNSMLPTMSYNTIYMPYDIVSANFKRNGYDPEASASTYTEGLDSVVLYVDDPVNLDKVKAQIKEIGTIDTDKFKLDVDDDTYQKMIEPIQNVSKFASNSIIVIIIAGVVILGLILVLFIRERIYEVGVLLSMGESKFKINCQLILEVLFVGIIAFSLSIFSGALLSKSISNSLLESEISSLKKDSTNNLSTMRNGNTTTKGAGRVTGATTGGVINIFGNNQQVEYIDSLEVNVTAQEIGLLFGCGTLIILLGVSIPVYIVSRYSPRRILSNQD